MTILYQKAVQKVRAQYVECDFADLPSGVFVPLIELPTGSLVIDGSVYVVVASDAATSEGLNVGVVGTPTEYATVASSKTAARTVLTLQDGVTVGRTFIGITRTSVGAQTVGHYALYVEYAIAGGSDATQG